MSHRPGETALYALIEQYNPRTGHPLSDVKDLLLRFLQDFFSGMPARSGLFHFEAGDPLGSTAETESELIITDRGPIGTDTVEKRAALVVSRASFGSADLSLNHFLTGGLLGDTRTHADLLRGSFVIYCVSHLGLEAEKLATLVFRAIQTYRDELQLSGFFNIGVNLTIGPETDASSLMEGGSDEDFVMVPVSFPVLYEDNWTATPTAETLNKINMTVYALSRRLDGSLLYPDAIDEDGNVNGDSEGVIVEQWEIEASE